jgi:Ca-activated chloride channel family protein
MGASCRFVPLLRADAGQPARSILEQQFTNPYDEPLRLRYALPLPVDGAVAGFSFRIGDRTVAGEIRSREEARERYEEALVEGRTGALVEQERPNLFTQELGNVPPHTDVTVEITVDQPLAWLPQGGWEYRFPTVAAPRYLGGPGRVDDAARVTLPVAAGDLPARLKLAFTVRGEALADATPESPSHAIRVETREDGFAVSLAAESGVALDRDVVLRWAAAGREPGVPRGGAPAGRSCAGSSAFRLLTIVPPTPDAPRPLVARDLIVLLDVSGSMLGEPLDQARALVEAMVDALGEPDTLEMIAFAMRAERWRSAPARMERATRAAALAWLRNLSADGGTEMVEGLREALAPLRPDAQRQVVLVTDGLIGFEDEAVREVIDHLPAGSRVHVVGVRPAVNH